MKTATRAALISIITAFTLAFLTVCAGTAHAGDFNYGKQYKRLLYDVALKRWGFLAPISLFAAQIHQESLWRKDAESKYASGLAQFTPSTAEWISKKHPGALGANAPLSPKWAIKALVMYDKFLYGRVVDAATDCERWAFVLSGYNGGETWRKRDQRICAWIEDCDDTRWFGHVEQHTNRASWAKKENRGYPKRILLSLEKRYRDNGWRGYEVCSECVRSKF